MAGFAWQEEEVILAVYLASIGVQDKLIVHIMSQRGFNRSLVALRNKLSEVRKRNQLGQPRHWNEEAVDLWIDEQMENYDVDNILKPSQEEQEIFQEVIYSSQCAAMSDQAAASNRHQSIGKIQDETKLMIFPETFLMELFRGLGQHLMLLFVCLKCVVLDFEAQESAQGNRYGDFSVFRGAHCSCLKRFTCRFYRCGRPRVDTRKTFCSKTFRS
jgi:hypothetical protein